jgi:hypothetical protein
MFEVEELRQLSYFLTKAQLAGNESVAHATLLIKIQRLIERESPTPEQKSQ